MLSDGIQPVALALSGGGAKCAAQAGALAVLHAAGVTVGGLTGVSAGGLVAVLFALGWPPEAIRDYIAETHLLQVWDFEPGRRGLLASHKMRARLDAAVGDRTFESLPVPVVVVAADLDSGREVYLDSGRLDDALMATMCFPGLFEPVCRAGQRLMDGGLLNPLPVDVARRWGLPVVALDMLAHSGQPAPEGRVQLFESHGPLGYLSALTQSVGLFGILDLVNQAVLLTTGRLRDDLLRDFPPDMVIQPQVASVGLFAFDLAAEAYERGAAAARDVLTTDHRPLTTDCQDTGANHAA
jgi:NTE family protein